MRGIEHRPELDPLIDEFDDVLNGRRVPEDVVVRRVTDIDHFDGPIDQLVNKTFRDPSFLSTSLGEAIPSSRPGIIHLKVPKGTPALYTGHHSAHGEGERELVLGRGLTIKFTRVFPHDGKIHLFAEVVPDVRHVDTPDVRRTPQDFGEGVPDTAHFDAPDVRRTPQDYGFAPGDARRTADPDVLSRTAHEAEEFGRTVPERFHESVKLMTQSTFGAVNRALYSGHDLSDLRRVMNTDGNSGLTEEAIRVAEDVDTVVKSAPDAVDPRTVWRGMRLPRHLPHSELMNWVRETFKVGENTDFEGFQFTSTDPAVASDFAHENNRTGVVLEVQTRKGAPSGKLSGLRNSESEYIQPRNVRYRTVGISDNVSFDQRFLTADGKPRVRREIVIHMVDVDDFPAVPHPHLDHLPPPNPTHRIEDPDPTDHPHTPDPDATQRIPREQLREHDGARGSDRAAGERGGAPAPDRGSQELGERGGGPDPARGARERLPERGGAPDSDATQRVPRERVREQDGTPDPEVTQRVPRASSPNPWGRRTDAPDQPGRGRGSDDSDAPGQAPGHSRHGQQPGHGQPTHRGHGQHPTQGQPGQRAGAGREDQGGADAWRRREADLYRNQPGEVDGTDPVPNQPSSRTSQEPDPSNIGTYSPQWKDMVDPQRISYDVPQERGRPPRARVQPGDPIFDKFGPKEHQWEQKLDLQPPPAYGEPGVHRGDRDRARYNPYDPGQVHQQNLTNAAGAVPLHTVPRWKNLLNPNYDKQWVEFMFNCSAVMRATVDLLQGRAVRLADGDFRRAPSPHQGTPGTPIPGDYDDSYEWMGVRGPGHRMDFQPLPGHPNSAADLTDFTRRAYQSVEDGLRGRPPGTVAAICIGWADGGGHWFAAYVDRNGDIRAIDTQPAPDAIDEPWPHVYETELNRLEFTIREPNGDWEGGSSADPESTW